ncbi:hypothetical protein [Lentzea aerocolonigenes]|uniref:hypothetical protein n=1 Tax=Lentzea aerocolonigenes TaxID=68170 RepID=UPI0004C3AD76|nr:hypothetical protein [Lentzea aerocolonigenes]
MRISRKPTGARCFELFTEIGANIGSNVELLHEFVRAPAEQRAEPAGRMHALEHAGDDVTPRHHRALGPVVRHGRSTARTRVCCTSR